MLALLARVLLIGVFVVAGIAKLADRGGVRRAVAAFGVPDSIAAPVGWALVCTEFGAVALLLVPDTVLFGGWMALALLLAFSSATALNLARGRRPDCHCFGRLSAGPVGWSTVARNGFLATLAAFVVLHGQFGWVFAALGVVALGLWIGPLVRRRWQRLANPGAAGFSLPDEAGHTWTLEALLAPRRPVVRQPACGACDALLPTVARWQHDLVERVAVFLVSGGLQSPTIAKAQEYGLRQVLIDERQTAFAAYGVSATPSAVLIAGDGAHVAALARGAGEIERLIERALEAQAEPGFTRRRIFQQAARGAAALTALPAFAALASACDPAHGSSQVPAATPNVVNKNEVYVDGAWLCNQPYALCTTASCEVSKTDPNIAVCHCVVQNGYSLGNTSCTQRKPSGDTLVSSFSTQNVNSNFHVMTCPANTPWANCLDMTCQVDATNPALANCQCQLVKTGTPLTFGGGCDTSTCKTVIWSAITAKLPSNAQYETAMHAVNQPVTFPEPCPSPTPKT